MISLRMKAFSKVITLCCLMTMSLQSYASLIFQFTNTEIPEIDFVGVESTSVHLYFGPDLLDIGDSFDLLIGPTPGSSEYASALNVHFDLIDISGFGFGGALELIPLSEQFFVTMIKTSGSFNVSGVSAYFINNGEGASFHGVAQRPENTIDVPETKSILLLLFAIGFMWTTLISNTYHNA